MLQIRLSKPSTEGGSGAKSLPADNVTVSCPDHLVLADLPVAKSLGIANATSLVKTVGRRSRRQLGERVHFCVRCDYPIAIYGRLSPCEHAFCLDCARSDSLCYLCDDRIQKIQTIKLMEGIVICAAPHCLKSFLKKSEFESHIHEIHADLLHPSTEKDGNESEGVGGRKPAASDTTVQAPPRMVFSPSSGSQVNDREERGHRSQPRDQPPRPLMPQKSSSTFSGQFPNYVLEQQPPGFERPGMQSQFQPQTFDAVGGLRQEPGQFSDKQQGIIQGSPFPEYPMHPPQPPNFAMPVTPNPTLPPQFGYPQFAPEGSQQYYGAPFEIARPDSTPDAGSEQGSLLGFPPGGFAENYPRSWNSGQAAGPFESSAGQGSLDGYANASDPQGRAAYFQGDYGRNSGVLPPPPHANKGLEGQGSISMDPRDGKGILAPQPLTLPPPPPLPPHQMSQLQRGRFYSGESSHDGQSFGWQQDRRDSYGNVQD